MKRAPILVFTVLLAMLVTSPAWADIRIAVHDFYGPDSDDLRDDVASLVARHGNITLVSKDQVEAAARELDVDPYSPDGRKALALELDIAAWITGNIKKRSSGKLRLTVVIYDGAEHERIGKTVLEGRDTDDLSDAIRRSLWKKSRHAIRHEARAPEGDSDSAVAGAAPSTQGMASTTPTSVMESRTMVAASSTPRASGLQDDSASMPVERKQHPDTLQLFVGFGSPYRSLAYSDPITPTLGDYQLGGAPMIDLNMAYYPAAASMSSWVSWLGLDVRAQTTTNVATVDREGNRFKSRYGAYHFGLRGRVPVAKHFVSLFSGYAINKFTVESENGNVNSPMPQVDYRMIRSGLGATFTLSDTFALGLETGYLHFLSLGEVATWFPRAKAGGIELAMTATYAISKYFFARASAAYQRYFFDFRSRPGDENAAGGATDQYLTFAAGAGVSL